MLYVTKYSYNCGKEKNGASKCRGRDSLHGSEYSIATFLKVIWRTYSPRSLPIVHIYYRYYIIKCIINPTSAFNSINNWVAMHIGYRCTTEIFLHIFIESHGLIYTGGSVEITVHKYEKLTRAVTVDYTYIYIHTSVVLQT